ncbi:hypothetical protein [Mycolicibacterium obuense]|uniref:Twin-arginine translocation pathway signal n=1 Tax=Mycolicibacterium obuense TaxID=1807 RepID=A0A0J6W1R1_9MYCO|nr:hypothetical protein [Mycolicibacterium obuense]KMO76339.1 hypothetical protein MOBUDSM44075_02331 [Mycolicibacterium obuense]
MSLQTDELTTDDADAEGEAEPTGAVTDTPAGPARWQKLLVYGIVPGLALVATAGVGWLKWVDGRDREAQVAAAESVAAAKDSTVAMLSYQPDDVDKMLEGAQSRLTGSFRDSYAQLIRDVVIPGAKEKKISAVASVPAAASVSATGTHATVMVFVNQTSTVGNDAPVNTSSVVRVNLDKVDGQWLVSGFDPV